MGGGHSLGGLSLRGDQESQGSHERPVETNRVRVNLRWGGEKGLGAAMGATFSPVLPHLGAGGATFTRFAGFACLTLQGNNGVLMERKQRSKGGYQCTELLVLSTAVTGGLTSSPGFPGGPGGPRGPIGPYRGQRDSGEVGAGGGEGRRHVPKLRGDAKGGRVGTRRGHSQQRRVRRAHRGCLEILGDPKVGREHRGWHWGGGGTPNRSPPEPRGAAGTYRCASGARGAAGSHRAL